MASLSIILAGLLYLVGLSAAVPGITIPAEVVDDALLAKFNLMMQYASAAYCRANIHTPGDQIQCNDGSCPLVNAANATSKAEYNSELATDVTGYVAADPKNKLIVIAFRGSSSTENWMTNFDFKLIPSPLCDGCTVHRGFWQSWMDARYGVTEAVRALAAANPTYKIVTTGHSLGGAISTLAAADLRHSGFPVTYYSFGAPRVANVKLANYITAQPGGNYRITHWNDPVPNIPPVIMNFAHVSPEYYINKPNKQAVKTSDVKVYEGVTNLRGNAKWLITDVLAHLWYFATFPDKCKL